MCGIAMLGLYVQQHGVHLKSDGFYLNSPVLDRRMYEGIESHFFGVRCSRQGCREWV